MTSQDATNNPSPKPTIDRRSFLGVAAAAAGAPLLARVAPGLGRTTTNRSLRTARQIAAGEAFAKRAIAERANMQSVLPAYIPSSIVKADIPSVNNSPVGFLKFPSKPVHTVHGKPGNGGTYTTMTPLWGSIPPANNPYYQAVTAALGANLVISPADGNTYGNALPPLFAANKIPDWIDIPGWNEGPLDFPQAVGAKFANLAPYIAGEKVKKYPNLAAIPTGAWQAGVWNNKLYGIPVYGAGLNFAGAVFYRADILAHLHAKPEVKSVADLRNLGREINDPKRKRWAFGELFVYMYQPFNIPTGAAPGWEYSNGKLLAAFETPQYKDLLVWERQIINLGLMHPQDVAQEGSNAKQRFYSGQTVIYGDGMGAWNWQDKLSGLAANPTYVREAFSPFTANGKGTPSIQLQGGAGIFSYLNNSLSPNQIEELLRIANYLAAPFGSYEYNLINYGVEGVDWTPTSLGPKPTSQGSTDVATTYGFLADPQNNFIYNPGYPNVTKDNCRWFQHAGPYATKPLFYDLNISVPPQLSAAANSADFNPTGTGSLIIEVTRSRASMADFDAAVKRWRASGGNALRAFYEKVYEQYYK